MTRMTKKTLAAGAVGIALVAVAVPMTSQAAEPATVAAADTTVNLTEMREEERMARDLYTKLAASSKSEVFTRIAASEQRHLEAVERLIEAAGQDADALSDKAGTYSVPELQKLYDEWLKEGSVSAKAAYQVGVELETADIAHLKALDTEDGSQTERVVANLLRASEHHLDAFQASLEGKAVNLGPNGQGNGMMNGRGQGRMGQGQMNGQGNEQGNGMGRGGMNRQGGGPQGDGTCPYAEDGAATS